MSLDLGRLNKEQREAVTHKEGPLLIIAGAGTGKTAVITSRIVHLIEEDLAKPEEILALTFTDKAANEMEERVDRMLDKGYLDLSISTFHSFCRRVLQERGLDIGIPNDFKLLGSTDTWLLLRRNLDRFNLDYYKPLGKPTKFIASLISHFHKCKDQDVTPEEYLEYAQNVGDEDEKKRLLEVASAYKIYQELLLEEGVLDFSDLINYTLRLFEKRPNVLEHYRKMFKYILIDEFQDTNWAQYKLAKMLAQPDNNIIVVSDDDQSVFRFRGASYGNIVKFSEDFPEAERISLVNNYRSRQNILDLAYNFIQKNNPNRLESREKVSKDLRSQKDGEATIEHIHCHSLEGEIQAVTNKIIELKKEDNSFSDFAILVRSNRTAEPFCRGLERANVPYTFFALRGLYTKPVVLDSIAYLKLLLDPYQGSSMYRVLRSPSIGVPDDDIATITRWSSRKSQPIYETIKSLSLVPGISQEGDQKIVKLLSMLRSHTKLSSQKSIAEIFIMFLNESGYLAHLTESKDRRSIDHVNQLYDKIQAFEDNNPDPSLRNFISDIELEMESGDDGNINMELKNGLDTVKIMTVHKAKGLEFRYVFLVNLVDRRFPATNRGEGIPLPQELIKDMIPEGDTHIEEERRLFYVAMTRARRGLFFTSALDYGGVRKKKLSRFLDEMGYKDKEPQKVEVVRSEEVATSNGAEKALPSHFSFSQFSTFQKCPYQYKFSYILKIPTKGKAVFSYGSTIHNTLERFVREKRTSLEDLLFLYKKEWIDDWFSDKKEEERYLNQGLESLKLFYQDYKDKGSEVLEVRESPAVEVSFKLKIDDDLVIGKIDRIDKVWGGGVEVIDYKTGQPKDSLKKEDKDQLLIYQIATEEVLGLDPKQLTYYYLDGARRLSFIGTKEDKKIEKERLRETISKIKKSSFSPTPGWACRFCDYKEICEYAKF